MPNKYGVIDQLYRWIYPFTDNCLSSTALSVYRNGREMSTLLRLQERRKTVSSWTSSPQHTLSTALLNFRFFSGFRAEGLRSFPMRITAVSVL